MNQLTIALLQMTAADDVEAARIKGETFCRRARDMGADIALFPEMWSIGYRFYVPWDQLTPADEVWRAPELWTPEDAARPFPQEAVACWQAQAIERDDPFILHEQPWGLKSLFGVDDGHTLSLSLAARVYVHFCTHSALSLLIVSRRACVYADYAVTPTLATVVNRGDR